MIGGRYSSGWGIVVRKKLELENETRRRKEELGRIISDESLPDVCSEKHQQNGQLKLKTFYLLCVMLILLLATIGYIGIQLMG